MTKLIADIEQRQQALDPSQSFIVQAPAGSGKTGLITQRFLLLLARVRAPEEIVAITFTRKAAAEMRQRLLEALSAAEHPLPEEADDYTAQTWQLARAALDNDQAQGWQLLQNPARLRIQTIDSLCAALTRQLPILSRFGAQPAISDDPQGLYREAARATLADLEAGHDWSPAIAALLDHLDNNLATAERMLVSMLAKREQWLRHLMNIHEPQWRELLEAALSDTVTASLQQLRAAFPPAQVSELMLSLDFASQQVDEGSPIFACRGLTDLPAAEAEAMPQWLGICELLLTKDNEWRKDKGVNKRTGFPTSKDKDEKARFKQKKDSFIELLALLREEQTLLQILAQLRSLPNPYYSDEQWQIVEAMCELLIVAVGHLRLVFGQRGEVDFSEMAQSALQALGDDEAPSDLALQLDYRIQHLLVDEFQDTAHGQFHLLQKLTAGWQPDDGRTLFVVGDPMQSIYRFREAEVGLYLRARQQGIGHVDLQPLTLSVNFRSQAGVVEWVNQSFAGVLPAIEDVTIGAVPYASSVAFHGHDGEAVQVHPLFDYDKAAEAAQVLALVQQALQQSRDGSVAVLVRARSHLVEISAALKQAGLRYRALEIERLAQQPVVQDLYALTRALLHPADRLAWLALLRAPWCGMALADLLQLAEADIKAVLWSQLQDEALIANLSAQGQAQVTRLRAVLVPAMQQRARIGLRRLLESVWLQLGGPACVDNETDLEDAEVMLSLIDHLDRAGGIDDISLLDEKLEKLFALPDIDADPRIQIMTVHKSKGLEFDTVILPGLGRKAPNNDSPMLMWLERWSQHNQPELLLAPLRATGDAHDAIYNYLRSIDKRKGEFENGRLLYVAATRARRRLHLLGHVLCDDKDGERSLKSPQSSSLLAMLWPVVADEFEAALTQQPKAKPSDAQMAFGDLQPAPSLHRLPVTWQPPEADSAVSFARLAPAAEQGSSLEFLWASDAARHIGSVVHALLQRIGEEGVAQWSPQRIDELQPYIRNALLREGIAAAELEYAAARVGEALSQTLNDERGRWILDASHQDARCEYAISGVLDGQVVRAIMDRSFIDAEGVRWIIDYKTGSREGGDVEGFLDSEQKRYAAQLNTYAGLMRLRESAPIRLALYFPLMCAWREWGDEI